MQDADDQQLLQEFARNHSEAAFATLVERHLNLVYSTALRFSGNPQRAEEIAQAVFILLVHRADKLPRGTILSGWLYQTARLTAANVVKCEVRRQRREQEAYMQSTLNEPTAAWEQIAPLLDEAMGRLGETDRTAVVLRFFENKSAREVAAMLKMTEAAAHKRVHRALDKLRNFFARRGVTLAAAAIAGAVSVNSVKAAPAALTKTVTAVALAKGVTASTSTITLIKGALKIMSWTKANTAIIAGVVLLLAAGVTTITVVKASEAKRIENLWRINKDVSAAQIDKLPPLFKVLPTKFDPPWVNWNSNANGTKFLGARARANIIAAYAYGFPLGRVHFATVIPPERFDFVATLPHGSREALRQWLKTKLGLVGRRETNDTQVLLLRVKHANARGLKPPILGKFDEYEKPGVFHSSDEAINSGPPRFTGLAEYLERYFKMPVIDETGLKQHFSIDLRWKETKGHPNPDGLKQILGSWLGLELVPATRPVVTLVMEKRNN